MTAGHKAPHELAAARRHRLAASLRHSRTAATRAARRRAARAALAIYLAAHPPVPVESERRAA